jgi:multiple sugar transport system substrate-binding protein
MLVLTAIFLLPACRPAAEAQPTLRVVCWGGLEEMKAEQENVDAFNALHPELMVKLESIPDNYLEKLVTAFAAGKPPDVLLLDSVLIPRFLDGGVLLDLQPYLARDPAFDPKAYFPAVWGIALREAGTGSQQVYALPKDFTPLVAYYNKRVFDGAGVAYPQDGWTWADFRNACAKLTADTDGNGRTDRYGTQVSSWMGYNIVWFWQAGGDVLDPSGTRATGYLDSPESAEAVRLITGLVADGLAPDPAGLESLGGNAFMNGRIGINISGHWAVPGFKAAARDANALMSYDDIGVVGLPQGRARAGVIYESGWAVAQDSPHAEAAVELAKYLSGPECQRRRAAIGLAISANRAVAAEFAADDPREQAFIDEVAYARAPWGTRISDWSVVEQLCGEAIERVLLGRATPEESLAETAKLVDGELHMFSAP